MNREIKFRHWDGEKYHYDICVGRHPLDSNIAINTIGIITDGSIESHDEPHNNLIEQYTGLKDKNGVEIYEGDIVKDYSGIGLYKDGKSHVDFYAGCFGVTIDYDLTHIGLDAFDTVWKKNGFKGDKEKCSWLSDLEVIGNIHDNPELV